MENSKIQKKEINEELQESYLDYAMSVIISRALPDVRDGLKPVHRRILYSMHESGFTHSAKFRKSANIVGEVLGKYHPHGDVAVYDSLARMAQVFSLRYPLIEGQGNWGSIDGDSPAAMRYTEARLSLMSEELLKDIDKETVDFQENYDATRKEPKVLPAKIPQLLINGTSGIAVGMATNIPPHNLSEVSDAVNYLIDHPHATTNELLEFIKGPDFPTGGIIYNKKAISEAYSTGRGSITARAKADIQERKHGQFDIVISEIPYLVNKSELLTKIAELVQKKKIEGIKDVRDESDRDGLSIIIQLKNDSHPQKVLNNLYKHTDLQKNFSLNMLALVDGIQPQTLSLKSVLDNFIKHREIVIRRRSEFDLKKAEARRHILEGLDKALKNIDAVIKTIKTSDNREEAHQKLVKNFKLTAIQADAILEMRLQTLVGLERKKIDEELKTREKEIAELKLILKEPKRILKIIKEETEDIKKRFGDERRTKVVASAIGEFKEEDLVPQEEQIIMMSQDGFIKRFEPSIFKTQKRGGRGVMGFETKEEDKIEHILRTNTHDNLLFFTRKGRVFQLKAYEIPQAPRTSRGKSIYNFLELPQNEHLAAILAYNGGKAEQENIYLIMLTKNGIIKKIPLKEFGSVRRSGLIAMKLKKEDELYWAKFAAPKGEIIILTREGQALRFKESDLRPMGRNASGVTAIRLKKGDEVCGFDVLKSGLEKTAMLLVVMKKGFGKQTPVKEYRLQRRAGQGIKTAKVTEKTGKVAAAQIVPAETKEVLVISKKGILIKIDLSNISEQSRVTQGVRIIKLESGDEVAGIVWF